jgi:hypothetical protein
MINVLIQKKPNAIFTLFCPRKIIGDKTSVSKESPSIIRINGGCVWGPANVFPVDIINKMFDWGRNLRGDNILHDDSLVGQFANANGVQVYTTSPGLVQHLAPNSSLLGYNDKRKISKVFDIDCDQYDWTSCVEKSVNIAALDF